MFAFISVYDKIGIEKFARALLALDWKIIASSGTAKYLKNANIMVTDLSELIGAGEIFHHKVVTLDRKFHAMLLADESPEETEELKKLGVPRIDLLCCDFYPQKKIGQTDIGGPTMVRSAIKGKRIVICDTADRKSVVNWLKAGRPDADNFTRNLFAKAEYAVGKYVFESAGGLGKTIECLYGENKWQTEAALYAFPNNDPLAHDKFKMLEGKDRSYINFTDIDRLLQSATHIAAGFEKNLGKIPKIAIGAKHGNLCGAGISAAGHEGALKGMLKGDPQAISGGWVLVNFAIKKKDALLLREKRILDGVIAPSFANDAIDILARKSGKCRVLVNKSLATNLLSRLDTSLRFRHVRGGFLTESNYTFIPALKDRDLLLAWAIGSTSNSNTITIVKNGRMIANAVGQQSRVLACRLALMIAKNAGHNARGAVAYSDSFFPFIDGPKVLADAGIKSVFVTSGSIRDKEVFAYFKSRGAKVISPPDKQDRGFYFH